jgi:tRNA/rRNA methyltransferase
MSKPRIILVEPAGALNVGSIARIMKNMGLEQLVLVNPQCDPRSEEAKKMAVHGIDILENALVVESLPTALQGCQRAIATTARSRSLPTNLESPRVALPWLLAENIQSALIFGREDRGLSNQELNYAQRYVYIPANPAYPSLNLAQAVAVCTYEIYQAWLEKDLDRNLTCVSLQKEKKLDKQNFLPASVQGTTLTEGKASLDSVNIISDHNSENSFDAINSAPLDVLEGYYQHLEAILLEIGYLYPHTAAARMEKFRRLYNRANLSRDEVAMLRGILRQIRWAIEKASD